jgi:DNA excision repair protein ERCC-6
LFCGLTQEQRRLYENYLTSEEVMSVLKGTRNPLSAVTELRKLCNHPDLRLLKFHGALPDNYGEWHRSGKMQVAQKLMHLWHEQGHRALWFTQTTMMLDIIEQFCNQQVHAAVDVLPGCMCNMLP